MTDEILFGSRTASENLEKAVDAGKLLRDMDGRLSLAGSDQENLYLVVRSSTLQCQYLNGFLFEHAYARQVVPHGCRDCFKIKVAPDTLRGLVALRDVLERLPHPSKCGLALLNFQSQGTYAGFLYFDGLAAARASWGEIRTRIDAHPHLGSGVPITIKRGCTNYETACGPSDRWDFAEGMAALEAELKPRFAPPAKLPRNYGIERATMLVHWIKYAYSMGDDTYLDFTGGRPLYPPTRTYPPQEPDGSTP